MLDEADNHWIAEHGYTSNNPLLAQVEHSVETLRANPQLGLGVGQRTGSRGDLRRTIPRSGWHRRYRCHAERDPIGPQSAFALLAIVARRRNKMGTRR